MSYCQAFEKRKGIWRLMILIHPDHTKLMQALKPSLRFNIGITLGLFVATLSWNIIHAISKAMEFQRRRINLLVAYRKRADERFLRLHDNCMESIHPWHGKFSQFPWRSKFVIKREGKNLGFKFSW
jgi:hypothetical protein